MSEFFYNDPDAPRAERLHLGAAVGIFRGGRLLLDYRVDGCWALLGGAMEAGENIEGCIRREIREELKIAVAALKLVGVFSDPTRIIRFANGTAVQSVTIAFATEFEDGDWTLSEESLEVQWFSQDEIDPRTIAATHRMIIPFLFRPELWPVMQ